MWVQRRKGMMIVDGRGPKAMDMSPESKQKVWVQTVGILLASGTTENDEVSPEKNLNQTPRLGVVAHTCKASTSEV